MNLFSGVGCEGEGPEPVVVGAMRVVEKELPRLGERISSKPPLLMEQTHTIEDHYDDGTTNPISSRDIAQTLRQRAQTLID